MNAPYQPVLDFTADAPTRDEETLLIDIDGFEGPLHVLLELARSQKVDLLKLSVTKLADQYLAFIRESRRVRFALAANYLVMAAWLTFLKSRLLLPKAERPVEDGAPPEAIALQLAFRIAKLDAMRRAAEALKERPILKRDVFTRGDPEAVMVISHRRMNGDVRALMEAYVQPRARGEQRVYRPRATDYYRLDDARDRLRSLMPGMTDWTPLTRVAPRQSAEGPGRASFIASTLSASLELVREGELEARQSRHWDDILLRATTDVQ